MRTGETALSQCANFHFCPRLEDLQTFSDIVLDLLASQIEGKRNTVWE